MKKCDYQIGPCVTASDFRGQGIYPAVINHIVSSKTNENTAFYMLVYETNTPSIKGIEKAGFQRVAKAKKSKVLGIFKVVKD